jgi:tRNA threonylcarbamoyl adenosine modification protein (Sua5/YciO/YrdC/YwlC family)
MSQFFVIHPDNPQKRLIQQAAKILADGGVIIYPTDSSYAFGCLIGEKDAMERIRRLRQLDDKHNFTLMCRDLSDLSTYAKVENSAYRLLKAFTPGPYTFLLKATKEVPRRLQHPKKKTIGIRVPDNEITLALIEAVGGPILTTTAILPTDDLPLMDPYEFRNFLENQVDLIIDGGYGEPTHTSVIDLTEEPPVVVREGKGDVGLFLNP